MSTPEDPNKMSNPEKYHGSVKIEDIRPDWLGSDIENTLKRGISLTQPDISRFMENSVILINLLTVQGGATKDDIDLVVSEINQSDNPNRMLEVVSGVANRLLVLGVDYAQEIEVDGVILTNDRDREYSGTTVRRGEQYAHERAQLMVHEATM